MKKNLVFSALVLMASLCFACSTTSVRSAAIDEAPSTASTVRVVVETAASESYPKLVFSGVYGNFMEVTDVTFESESGLIVPLSQYGSREWVARLTPEQYKLLLVKGAGGEVKGSLLIRSINTKHASNVKKDVVDFRIRGEVPNQEFHTERDRLFESRGKI